MNFRNLEKGTPVFLLEDRIGCSKKVRHEFVDEDGLLWERYEWVEDSYEILEYSFQGIYEPKLYLLTKEEIEDHPETEWVFSSTNLETFIVLEDVETNLWECYSEEEVKERKFYLSKKEAELEILNYER